MHISDAGVLDTAAYAPAEESETEPSTAWADLAVVVPYAVIALLTAVATAASGTGVSWMVRG